MHIVEATDLAEVRRTLWAAADELRANSTLAPNEYRVRCWGSSSSPTPSAGSSRSVPRSRPRPQSADRSPPTTTGRSRCFPDGVYIDVPGLYRVAKLAEIEAQGWSLNPGRYTGTASVDDDGEDFTEKLGRLYDELTRLSDEADVLQGKVNAAVQGILGA